MTYLKRLSPCLLFFLFFSVQSQSQKLTPKYQGLLWEISGNGLSKPSYLFGTMHVSSKLAFHLSDSFYYALKQVDAVALELNPVLWQPQMVHLAKLNENYSNFIQNAGNDFITENSFRISNYEDGLKAALSTEPPVVNSLLYRSYKIKDDFEEDTFLDLFIFQTGRKLGKAAAGVEDYYESEKLVLEAYRDMANEKKKKEPDLDGESMGSILEKLQNAYRYGDLDLMDSLDLLMDRSPAFREKFLYKRNEIQANSIDSIIRTRSLFAGVGAAHLPGDRGVIELLRKKGYTLRAVKMADRDAIQKETVSQMKVPVTFARQFARDSFYTVETPGPLYSLRSSYQELDRNQFADMENGAYYMVTRVKTYAALLNKQADVIKKVDSVLYENIPGQILQKQIIHKNGYPGYDITNRTRRGDLQRYQIFITPFEVIIFKMSGKKDYVAGQEAQQFFESIHLKEASGKGGSFQPSQGGFSLQLPQEPHVYFNNTGEDRWEYEALDKATGDAFILLKKTVYNYNFLESDSFNLALVEASFESSDFFEKQLSRKQATINGYPALLVREKWKDGNYMNVAFILQGPHRYVLCQRSNNSNEKNFTLYKTLNFLPYDYATPGVYKDSFLLVNVHTPVKPELDNGIRSIIEKTAEDVYNGNNQNGYITYWKKPAKGQFESKPTGEMISVQVQEYPKYYYIRDSAKFWKKEIDDHLGKDDMVLYQKKGITLSDGSNGYYINIRDTGSSSAIEKLLILKGRYLYELATVTDTLTAKSTFLDNVFSSFLPNEKVQQENMYDSKFSLFVNDLFSTDSALHKKAQQAINNVYFSDKDASGLNSIIQKLSVADKNYFDSKARLISELGYIDDTTYHLLPGYLQDIYEKTADTSLFQNEVMLALARIKTADAFKVLKNLLLQDPPIFDDNNDLDDFFENLGDSLQLTRTLFPQLLQLATISDYKENINSLLVMLVDSGFISGPEYADYFAGIYIDAKVAWKKQQAREEKIMEANNRKAATDDAGDDEEAYNNSGNSYELSDHAILLMPFYDNNKNVPVFFKRLLQSRDDDVRLNTAVLLLRHQKPVADSILKQLAASDKYRGELYARLEEIGQLDKFPKAYATQLALAKSFLASRERGKIDSIVYLEKKAATIQDETGMVYFFKYRLKKTDDWKIGFSGLQPLNPKALSSEDKLAFLTDKKIVNNEPLKDQLDKQLKKAIFGFYRGAKNFYRTNNEYRNFRYLNE